MATKNVKNRKKLIKSLREAKYDVPILIITAKSEIEDKKDTTTNTTTTTNTNKQG